MHTGACIASVPRQVSSASALVACFVSCKSSVWSRQKSHATCFLMGDSHVAVCQAGLELLT